MKHRSTSQLVQDLRKHDRLIVVEDEVDPHLELAEIHRRVFRNQGPALLFQNVKDSRFPVASNLFGTLERARFIFRDTFRSVQLAVKWKTDPKAALKEPWQLWRAPGVGLRMMPSKTGKPAVKRNSCRLSELPQVVCWPDDGGAFVTLPQVISQAPGDSSLSAINMGMYRIQLSGNEYVKDKECGLHYQIHRGIGVHHAAALDANVPLPVNITVGGTPAMTVGAVMPLPEGMSELMFAGALAGHRVPVSLASGLAPLYGDADFAICGEIDTQRVKPEGPFGDHLGYYARVHDFPFLNIKHVYHRDDAIWPITVVGRPPQEDTTFGELIHELTGPVIPTVLPGVREVHAVDAAGVHPLLLAVGSERYTPYKKTQRPQELLTQACAILGQGQLSLAKYLWIIDGSEDQAPAAHDIAAFLAFALERLDWRRDLHFHTCTTMDTLDYSGSGLNEGSKVVLAASGPKVRDLPAQVDDIGQLPSGISAPKLAIPGVLLVQADSRPVDGLDHLKKLNTEHPINRYPLVVIVDDADFAARNLDNFLWTTFTRSNPAADIHGIGEFNEHKHYGCRGSLIIDARIKEHHAPGLMEDKDTLRKVDARAARNDALARYL